MTREEALKQIRNWSLPKETREVLEALAPELRESEDERIRKYFIWIVNNVLNNIQGLKLSNEQTRELIENYDGIKVSDMLTYLEKQKESLHISETCKENADSFTDEDERTKRMINTISYKMSQYQPDIFTEEENEWFNAYLEKQKEQNPVQEIEPTPIFRIGDILKRKGKDYTFRVDRIQGGYYHCDRNHGAFFPIEEQVNWELVEQKPAEWSEEDEKDMAHIIRILDDCYAYGKHDLSKTDHENLVNKLKSLRPSWKPSEEQMD